VTALGRFGAVRGTALTVWRLLRCNPWSRGGVDHVPAELARGRVGKPLIGTEMEPAI
jgi:putative component of membrane protein insertase Oxa1/YidC/SpoIIIJ protein YidD